MKQVLRLNDRDLPMLDEALINALFQSVYSRPGEYDSVTEKVLDAHEDKLRQWFDIIKAHQDFNYQFRWEQCAKIHPHVESILGPFEGNSEGPIFWFGLILAIKELYGMRMETLLKLLRQVHVRR